MPKIILILIVAGLLGYFGYNNFFTQSEINSDTVIKGDYKINKGKTVVLKNGSKLTVEGKVDIAGILKCEGGSLNLESKGDLKITGAFICNRKSEDLKKGSDEQGINIIGSSNITFDKDSVLASNAHIQIVESADLLLKTKEDYIKAFNEIAKDEGEGIRVGPLLQSIPQQSSDLGNPSQLAINPESQTNQPAGANFISTAHAQDIIRTYSFNGKIVQERGDPNSPLPPWVDLEKIPKEIDILLYWVNLPNGDLELFDSVMFTPDGHDAKDIIGGCDISAPKAEDIKDENGDKDSAKKHSMRMRARAKNIKVRNFLLFLGDGGQGGDAITDKDCDPEGKAVAGHGGNPANFKWTAENSIDIQGNFYIYPGKGGDGGKAVAHGKKGADGCPGEDGRNATATGGWGRPTTGRCGQQVMSGVYKIFLSEQ